MALPIIKSQNLQFVNGEWVEIQNRTSADIVSTTFSGKSVQQVLDELSAAHENFVTTEEAENFVKKTELAGIKTTKIVADITERDNLEFGVDDGGVLCWVVDATADPTVDEGAALYGWDGEVWVKLAEVESMDVVINWANIQGKPSSTPANIDDAVTKKHAHEKSISEIDEAVGKVLDGDFAEAEHTHDYTEITNTPPESRSGNITTVSDEEPENPEEGDTWIKPIDIGEEDEPEEPEDP